MSEAAAATRAVPSASNPGRGTPSLLAEGAGFTGLLDVHGGARIDGELDGEIVASGTLWIGESGRVRARVEAQLIVIAGELEGEICASGTVELQATARVRAALRTPRLVLADGAFFEGRCRAGGKPERPAQEGAESPNSKSATP